jgi:predicted PurR-regulated permease PerM
VPSGPPRIEVPRWIQLVGLPLLLLFLWVVAGAARHVVFLFLVAALIALLLNPLVRGLGRVWIPRGFAVAFVYLAFAAVVALAIVALGTGVVSQTRSASHRVDSYFTARHGQPPETHAQRDLKNLQHWLDTHHLKRLRVERQGRKFLNDVATKDVSKWTSRAITWAEGAGIAIFTLLFDTVLIAVVSIYMLLDLGRFARAVDRRFPPRPGQMPLLTSIEHALASYVRGQALLSLIIGASAGVGVWLLGTIVGPHGLAKYAVLFALWVGVTELIPYLGPWLGAIPPVAYAIAVHPVAAIWVALLFLVIHQVEGHVVVPNVMGSALRLHPLLVIFGLLAGAEVNGLAGVLIALPLLAAARATWEFFGDRVALEHWEEGVPPVPVEVEPPETRPTVVGR